MRQSLDIDSNCSNFFNFIFITFGLFPMKMLKLWIKHRKNIIKNKARIKFLKICIQRNLIPQHLKMIYNFNINIQHSSTNNKLMVLKRRTTNKVLQLELNDAHRSLHSSNTQTYHLVRKISRCIPVYLCNSFFKRQEYSLYQFARLEFRKIDKKINWLITKHNKDNLKLLKPIHYTYTYNHSCSTDNNGNNCTLAYITNTHQQNYQSSNEIRINPSEFAPSNNASALENIKSKWFVNLSNHTIPNDVQCLLQLGSNFSLPSRNTKKDCLELIKNLENNSNKLPIDTFETVRNRSISILNNLTSYHSMHKYNNTRMFHLLKTTKNFLRNNPQVIFTRADKGNITVALDQADYSQSISQMLQDTDTYDIINKDPIRNLTNKTRELLTRWLKHNFITTSIYKKIFCSDGTLPRAYGLPKIHKPGSQYRIIVSTIDSPLYPLAVYLHKIINDNIPKPRSHIKNSLQLIEKIKNKALNDNQALISLDVVSLFTNIPIDLAIECISKKWHFIADACKINKEEFLKGIRLVLDSTFFIFDNRMYRQKFGTPMGSPLSPIIADLVMEYIEERALEGLETEVSFYYRYVDDIIMAVPQHLINKIVNVFNSQHNRLKFTLEIGGNELNFLDITIIKKGSFLEFDWFHKPTFSGRFLSFMSSHPISQKRGIITNGG